jgi:tetratricopeptide (TPR) repeat protein
MQRDLHGLAISAGSADAAAAFDRAILGYLKYRADAPERLARLLKADPEFGLAHCLKGYFAMLSFNRTNLPAATEAADAATRLSASATAREQAHVAALRRWIAGDLDGALAVWEDILAAHPLDVLAFRLAHFNNFWLGRPQAMRASVERVLPAWASELPGYGAVLSCRCFASEECGDYAAAEPAGWAALAADPADFWGIHALAHVMEMQGRHRDGIALMNDSARHFDGGNNLLHHLSWHRALFHLERREFDAVLDLYDRQFRDLASPLTQGAPDLYIDVQNAASMLFRLERCGIDVGNRWSEIADKAEARIGDCLSAFTLPHWMMALAADGRDEAAERMLDAMRAFGRGEGTVAGIVGEVALPVCEGVLAHRRGDYARAVGRTMPVLSRMPELGGSHAQQDVLLQLLADAAVKTNRRHDLRAILAHASRGRTPPLAERIGYAGLAH